ERFGLEHSGWLLSVTYSLNKSVFNAKMTHTRYTL
uniref:Uncharacterized protein n=1 Tax=Anopheles funestus TaxID=62324 RepID=A0A182S365_ANOFN